MAAGNVELIGPKPWQVSPEKTITSDILYNRVVISSDAFGVRGQTYFDDTLTEVNPKETWHVLLHAPQPQSPIPWGLERHADIPKAIDIDGIRNSQHHRAVRDCWARTEHAVPHRWTSGNKHPATVLYRTDVYEPWPQNMQDYVHGGSPTFGPLNFAALDSVFQACGPWGYWPHRIGANGSIHDPRFMLTIVPQSRNAPKVRYFFAFNHLDPDQPTWVEPPPRGRGAFAGPGGTVPVPDTPSVDAASDANAVRAARVVPRWGRTPFLGAPRPRIDLMVPGNPSGLSKGAVPRTYGDPSQTLLPVDHGGPHLFIPPSYAELLGQIDDIMRDMMERGNARQAQLFIGQEGHGKLGRNYTLAEQGFRLTKTDDKLAIASNSKPLTGMAFAGTLSDAPGIPVEERLLPLRDAMLVDEIGMHPLQILARELENPGDGPRLEQTSIEHLLRHQSGWVVGFDWGGQVLQFTGTLPLRAGQFQLGLKWGESGVPLYAEDPGIVDPYDGANFIILGEVLSRRVFGADAFTLYAPAMRTFWQHEDPDDEAGPAVVMPWTRAAAFVRGIAPMITCYPMAFRAFLPGEPNVGDAPWRPAPWAFPYEFDCAAGGWAMSMRTKARILQGMDPNPGPNVHRLLAPGQFEAYAAPSAIQAGFGLGIGSFVKKFEKPFPFGGSESHYRVVSHAGEGWATGSYMAHMQRLQGGGANTISVAVTVLSDKAVVGWGEPPNPPGVFEILNLVHKINHLGYWDNVPDLFAA